MDVLAKEESRIQNSLTFLCIAIVIVAISGNTVQADCPKAVGDSVRVLTYNVSFPTSTPTEFWVNPTWVYVLEDDERATQIADKIKEQDPDIIALTEVLDNDIKDKFVELLKDTYPNYVYMIDDEWDSLLNDSGLMFFSKYSFMRFGDEQGELPSTAETDGRAWVWVDGEEKDDDEAFVRRLIFEQRVSDDHWAEKGAGLVRFRQECSDDRFNITATFSHAQAGYVDDSIKDFREQMWARRSNLMAIKWLIEDSLTVDQIKKDLVLVLGDLNTNGNPGNFNTSPYNPYVEHLWYNSESEGEPHSEWDHHYKNIGTPWEGNDDNFSFYSRGSDPIGQATYDPGTKKGGFLIDAWGFETSPKDFGQTNSGGGVGGSWYGLMPGQGERLDYVLHNRPEGNGTFDLCLQYIYKGVNFISSTGTILSDHTPVIADFNRRYPRCSITKAGGGYYSAQDVIFDLADANDLFKVYDGISQKTCFGPEENSNCSATTEGLQTKLKFNNSMQWYKIDSAKPGQTGSYEIILTRPKCEGSCITDATTKAGSYVQFALYHESNLSEEYLPQQGKCKSEPLNERHEIWKCKYLLDSPPYYVRVFHSKFPDSNVINRVNKPDLEYKIIFRRFTCKNKNEACFLPKHKEVTQWWPPTPLDPSGSTDEDKNTMWFEFTHEYTDTSDADAQFIWKSIHSSFTDTDDPVKGTIVTNDNPPQPLTWSTDFFIGTDAPTVYRRGTMLNFDDQLPGIIENGADIWEKPYYLKLTRYRADQNPPDKYINTKFQTRVTFKTHLTYFHPTSMKCIIERTDIGEDDIWMKPNGSSCHPSNDTCFRWGLFDATSDNGTVINNPTIYGLYPKFSNQFKPYIFEDVDDDEAVRLQNKYDYMWIYPLWWTADLVPKADDADPNNIVTTTWQYEDPDTDYSYTLTYFRSKERKSCSGMLGGQSGFPPLEPCPAPLVCSKQGYCCPAAGCSY
jgi:hypothetical protein